MAVRIEATIKCRWENTNLGFTRCVIVKTAPRSMQRPPTTIYTIPKNGLRPPITVRVVMTIDLVPLYSVVGKTVKQSAAA